MEEIGGRKEGEGEGSESQRKDRRDRNHLRTVRRQYQFQ